MTLAEGGGRRAVYSKLRDMYVPTLKANYVVWPAVQVINFRLMPVQFQLVSISNPDCMFSYPQTTDSTSAAFRIYRWYCLDRVPLLDQCR